MEWRDVGENAVIVNDARPPKPRVSRPAGGKPRNNRRRNNKRRPSRSTASTEQTDVPETSPSRPERRTQRRVPFFQRIYESRVKRLRERDGSRTKPTANDGTSIFMQNLPFSFDQAQVEEWLQHNNIDQESVKLLTVRYFDKKEQQIVSRSIGKGFIKMKTVESADEFLKTNSPSEMGGRKVFFSLARSGPRVRIVEPEAEAATTEPQQE
ncbi:hypothetical protein GEMRC1_002944 [Eukaryota sp. GEM-RC1]